MTVRWLRWDRTASRDRADRIDHALPAEPIDKMGRNEPIDATDSIEPTEPIDSTEPFDAIERNESSDQSEKREFIDDITSVCRTCGIGSYPRRCSAVSIATSTREVMPGHEREPISLPT